MRTAVRAQQIGHHLQNLSLQTAQISARQQDKNSLGSCLGKFILIEWCWELRRDKKE